MPLDYSGQNLRDRSFVGRNLEGANFSGADIRGANFSGANLRGANFSGAKAGLQKHWVISLFIFSLLLSATSGFISAVSGAAVALCLISGDFNYLFAGVVSLVVLAVFLLVAVNKNLIAAFVFLATAATIAIAIAPLGAVTAAVVKEAAVTVAAAAAVVGTGFLAAAVVVLGAIAVALAGLGATVGAVIATLIVTTTLLWVGSEVVVRAVTATGAMILAGAVASSGMTVPVTIAGAVAWAVGVTTSSTYVGWGVLVGDEKSAFVRDIAVTIATIIGTHFQQSDLTNADFTQATLHSTDFRGAKLSRTSWFQVQKLNYARLGKSYLQDPKIQQLVITKNGQGKNFDGLNLRAVNLRGASLVDTSFIGTDLSLANLQDTDLSRAKLVQTQLDGTDLTGATLTGATIEDWNITSRTILQGVRCEYIFMQFPTPDDPNPHRKPDNWNEAFKDGDFADFIKPIIDTLDLYHNSGVDPRAIAISFKQLAENHPDAELEIVAMEKRGQDKFLLRAKTAPTADKSELSAEYFTIYNELKALAQQEIKALVAEKDIQIHRLENMVMTALERPSFYAQTYNNQGDTMGNRNINMGSGNYNERIEGNYVQGDYREGKQSHFNLQGAQFGGGLVNADTVNAHQIGGNIYNSEQRQNPEQVKTILILAANPKTTSPLRLDEEVREIDAGLQRAKKRDQFDLKQRWAARIQDVYQSLLDCKPQIVHFSGHGTGDDGLVLEDETGNARLVDTIALAGLFELFANTIECVVLNACYSEVQASAISQHIPYVIGMKKEVGDKAAIKFATGFYSALGAGESVEFAYKLGCSVIQLDGVAKHLTPVLKKKQP